MTALAAPRRTQTPDITALGAGELAALIANGDLSSTEVVEAHIARIEAVNPRLNVAPGRNTLPSPRCRRSRRGFAWARITR